MGVKALTQTHPLTLFGDNQASLKMAQEGADTTRTKHIDIKYHYLKDLVKTKTINVTYEDTSANLADLLTKGKPKVPHTDNTLKVLGMKPLAWWHYGVFSTRSFPQKFSSLYLLRDLL